MELTVDQALQQGITAHKEGKFQDAERLYRAILQSQPAHPDANHNLAVLAVSMNKVESALPLFKAALDAKPKEEQFWLSYIDALIKQKQPGNAKQVIQQAKNQGLAGDKLNALESKLSSQIQNVNTPNPSQQQLKSLLEYYQSGRYDDAEKSALLLSKQFPHHNFSWKILGAVFKKTSRTLEAVFTGNKTIEITPDDAEAHNNLGNTLKELGRLQEAEVNHRQATVLRPAYAEAHNNLGNTLKELGRLEESEASFRQAIALKSDYAEAHSDLGHTLQELSRLDEAEGSYRQAIALKPDYVEAHNNLGVMFKELGRLDEAEVILSRAIALKPDFAEARNNLGITLKELGRLDESEVSYKQAIALKSDYASARNNLGITLQELRRLEEAEASYRHAIELKPDYADAHQNLGVIFYMNDDIDAALESLEKANHINPNLKNNKLLLAVLRERKAREKFAASVGNISKPNCVKGLTSNPLVLNRMVEEKLIVSLYDLNSTELDKTRDARYGKGRCSSDFNLFTDECAIIKTVAEDLTSIMRIAVQSEIYVEDSFFNILGAGAGSTPHMHLNTLDENKHLDLAKQKYSLVYYLSVGDQNCSDPGILKLYDPCEDILPCKGMIVIIPADRKHSAVYGGGKDRVMIGINFYSL